MTLDLMEPTSCADTHGRVSQVACIQAVEAAAGREALQDAETFIRSLSGLERSSAYSSDRAILELPTLWRFANQVQFRVLWQPGVRHAGSSLR